MKHRKFEKRIAAWFLCLAMILTTVNLPAFTTVVQAAGTINITKVQSGYNDVAYGDYGGVSIYFDPVEGATSYYATLYEQRDSGDFLQIQNFTNFTTNETTGEMLLYCSEAHFLQYGAGMNVPLFKFVIYARDSHENSIAEGETQIRRTMWVLDTPIINIEPSGVVDIKFGPYSNRASIVLYEKKYDGTKRYIKEFTTDITDIENVTKIDMSDDMDKGYEYEVIARAYSNGHFWRNSVYGSSGFTEMTGIPAIMTTLNAPEMEIGKTTEMTVDEKKADTYEWVVGQGTTGIAMDEVKKHATVVGENSEAISITPHDDFLAGKTIACQVSNSNGMSSTNKVTIKLSGRISSIALSNFDIKMGMTVGDFKQNVSIDNPFAKINYIDVRDSGTKKKMGDADVFESVGRNSSGYMIDIGLKTNSSADITFDLNKNTVTYDAINASMSDVSNYEDEASIVLFYKGEVLEDKKISGYPLHVGDTLSTDVNRFQVEGDQGYTIKEINWGIYNDDNGKILTSSDTSVILKVTLAPDGLNELIWENAGVKGYQIADSVLKMKMGDTLLTGNFYSTEAATQYTKDETVTYIFEIKDIKNPECVYNVNELKANGKDIVAKRTSVIEVVSFNMDAEGSISYEAGLDKNAAYGDLTPIEGEICYESKISKLSNNTYDALNPDLVLTKNALSMKDISSLESGDYFVVVTAKNKKYDMEKSIWGAYKLTVTHGVHIYASAWQSDASNHWKECTCGTKKDEATHDFSWIIDREATDEEVGLKHQECSVCGYKNYVPFGTVKTIELTVAEPEVGGAPDMNPKLSDDASQYMTIDRISWIQYKPTVLVYDEYSTFEKGIEYKLAIYLKPIGECKYDSNTVVKVNGKTVNTKDQPNSGELYISMTYYPGLIRMNDLHFDVKYPKPRETEADTSVTLVEAGTANILNSSWYNVNSLGGITNQVSGEFESGKYYVLRIWFSIADGYYFDQKNTNVYINHSLMKYDSDIDGLYYSYDMSFKCENHNLTLVPSKDATCAVDGNKAYYACSDCDVWFEDAEAKYVIADKSKYVIPATGNHDFSEYKDKTDTHHTIICKECGEVKETVEHNYGKWDTESGTKKCKECEYIFTCEHSFSVKKVSIDTKKSDATCTESAKYYYTCKDCGAIDINETVEAFTSGDANGHSYANPVYTWSENNNKCLLTLTCTKCGESTEGHLTSKEMTVTANVKKEASCKEEGIKEFTARYTLDGNIYEDKKEQVISKTTEHSYVNGVCSVCGDKNKLDDETTKLSETTKPGETTKPSETTKPGETTKAEENITVKEEPTTVVEESTIAKEESTTVIEENTTVKEEPTTVVEESTIAKEELTTVVEESTTAKEEPTEVPTTHSHKWNSGKVTKKATYAAKGVKTYTCKTCGKTKKKSIAKLTVSKVKISSFKSLKKSQISIKWTKNSKATGYQVQYSKSKSFAKKNTKTVTVKSAKTVSKTIKKLTRGKRYYVRVRVYKTEKKKNYYSSWCSVKSVKVKK